MSEDPKDIGEDVDAVLSRVIPPEKLEEFERLKEELREALEQERKHAKGAERFLRKRKAPREQFEELRAKREKESRRLKAEFAAKVRELLDSI